MGYQIVFIPLNVVVLWSKKFALLNDNGLYDIMGCIAVLLVTSFSSSSMS